MHFVAGLIIGIILTCAVSAKRICNLESSYERLKKQRDYWEREAKKWADKTFDIRYKIAKKICDRCPDEDSNKCNECVR